MTRSFTLFSLTHFTAIFIVTALIAMAILRLRKRAPSLNEDRFNHWLGVLVISNAVFWNVVAIRGGYFTIDDDLPFHLCDISPYLIAAYLWKPRQSLFDILFYWTLAGATLALILPDLTAGYPSSEFSGFFIAHGLPLFAILHLILVQGVRPSRKSVMTAFIALNLYALFIAAPVDLLVGGNYVYLRSVPLVDFNPINLLPPWPWYIPIIDLFALVLFHAMYQLFHLLAGKEETTGLLTHSGTSHR
ncbi:MAG: TIGR02206 family membrane protein [Fidelibacterota bacterium]|nr:MAG: TIGR02206 family membrane protein [Candidatus Neomarinimicrobiota bacterium]